MSAGLLTNDSATDSAPKTLLLLTRTFPPDTGAIGVMANMLARALAEKGWQSTLVVQKAEGAVSGYSEIGKNVGVWRISSLPCSWRGMGWRALGYLALYPLFFLRSLFLLKASIVITTTDPPMQAVLGTILGKLKSRRVVHWCQDLYPEVAEAAGVIKPGGWPAHVLRKLSTWALCRSDAVVAIGRCMQEKLVERGVCPKKIHLIENWADPNVAPLEPAANPLRKEHGLEKKFVVMYSGNFGLAHPFGAMIEAAAWLQERTPSVVWVLAGQGPRRAWVEKQIAARGLSNVQLWPWQPVEKLSQSLGVGDLHVATLEPGMEGLIVPSKIYGILAAGRPCLFLGSRTSEVARLLEEAGSGRTLENADGPALGAAILEVAEDAGWSKEAGVRARERANAKSLDQAAEAFDQLLCSLLTNSSS